MEVIPTRLVELAQQCLAASQEVTGASVGGAAALQLDGSAAGNSDAAPTLITAHQSLVEAASQACDRLVATLEHDYDGLLAVAFDVSTTDLDQAQGYETQLSFVELLQAGVV
ncbi:hypothetical protein GCM10023340_07800 [Nocardioides marinquilinus]|uniref:PE domain-containing protein n=1 Tax=Nocardioides marinquilinus TaxID=1210400 RepID=A0ABP9PER8_9ACTN